MDAYIREIEKALNFAQYLKFDKNHPWHRNLIALYGALIEYSDSLVHLVENEKTVAIAVVFRSLLEAYVDFKNLANDKNYGYYMEASYLKEWLKFLKNTSEPNNPHVAIISDDELMKKIQEHKKSFDELKSKGYSPLSNHSKFEKADMINDYLSIYSFVCLHSHNNIVSLVDRFIIIDKEKDDFEIALFKENNVGEFDKYLLSGIHILRNGSHDIHKLLETGHENEFPI